MMRHSLALLVPLVAAVIGLASAHAAQPAAVTPATGSAPTIIFFAWDKPEIDGDAAASLDRLAAVLQGTPDVRLRLIGHADRSGPATRNVQSGRSRAEAVATYLAAHGVPVAAMMVMSLGEARPLIPTADGVREPQNRRVEIMVERASRP